LQQLPVLLQQEAVAASALPLEQQEEPLEQPSFLHAQEASIRLEAAASTSKRIIDLLD
jgi:hypothetical protein